MYIHIDCRFLKGKKVVFVVFISVKRRLIKNLIFGHNNFIRELHNNTTFNMQIPLFETWKMNFAHLYLQYNFII